MVLAIWRVKPVPAPTTAMYAEVAKHEVPVSMVDRSPMPTTRSAEPRAGRTLYLPVAVMALPAMF
ncbi:hypothetical protein GCM10010295_07260 [Streptomyces intermedius]